MANAQKGTDEELIERTERALVAGVWTSIDGTQKKFTEMDDGHLANSILMIRRGSDARGRPVGEIARSKLSFLEAEWRHRHGDKEVVSDRPFRGTARKRKTGPHGNSPP
jgi:hypothetical protein